MHRDQRMSTALIRLNRTAHRRLLSNAAAIVNISLERSFTHLKKCIVFQLLQFC